MKLGLGLGTGNGYLIAFFSPCLKVTNTFVLPSWPGAWSDPYLAGARMNQWAWHRKHMTTVTSCCEQSTSHFITNGVPYAHPSWGG